MCLLGLMTTRISAALEQRFRWLDIRNYPPQVIWQLMPQNVSPDPPDMSQVLVAIPLMAEAEAPWWCYPFGATSAKPPWWDSPIKEVRVSILP